MLEESRDFVLRRFEDQFYVIATLRSQQRIYASSLNVDLLSATTESLILKQLQKNSLKQQ